MINYTQEQLEEFLSRGGDIRDIIDDINGGTITIITPPDNIEESIQNTQDNLYYVKYKSRLSPSKMDIEKTKFNLKSIKNVTKTTDVLPSIKDVVIIDISNDGDLIDIQNDPFVLYVEPVPIDIDDIDINDTLYHNTDIFVKDTFTGDNDVRGYLSRIDWDIAIEDFGFGNHYPVVALNDSFPSTGLSSDDLISQYGSQLGPGNIQNSQFGYHYCENPNKQPDFWEPDQYGNWVYQTINYTYPIDCWDHDNNVPDHQKCLDYLNTGNPDIHGDNTGQCIFHPLSWPSHPDMVDKVELLDPNSVLVPVDLYNGHGTGVAGIITTNTNDNYGMPGVCPNCTISWVSKIGGILPNLEKVVQSGIKVVNWSFGNPYGFNTTHNDAINDAVNAGVIIVNSAGNSNYDIAPGNSSNPDNSEYFKAYCIYDGVICVGNSNYHSTQYYNYDSTCSGTYPGPCDIIDVSVPANAIYFPNRYWFDPYGPHGIWEQSCIDEDGNYFSHYNTPGNTSSGITGNCPGIIAGASGTSQAAPIVTGVIGLLLSHNPDLTRDEIIDILHNSNINPPRNSYPMAGELNVHEALTYLYNTYMDTVKGDIDQSGSVTSFDIEMAINYILGIGDIQIDDVSVIDVYEDGTLDIRDIIEIIRISSDGE